jgi:glutaconate CoA-transferase subunit B
MAQPDELMTITTSRLLEDGRVVFAGVGAPLLAAAMAKRRHAPDLTIVLEGGIIGAHLLPGVLHTSTNEMRAAFGCEMLTDITDIFLFAQRGHFDYGLLGAAQVDMFGNINTSFIGDPAAPSVRLPGSGGANDIISLCNSVFVVTTHEPRRFVERVDFVTSPGYLGGGQERERAGLIFGQIGGVVTDLAFMDFEPETRRMRLRALQEEVTVARVVEMTGFDLVISPELSTIPAPSSDELALYRSLRDGPTDSSNLDQGAVVEAR